MELTSQQLQQLIEAYAEQVVEGMDIDCLVQFAYETIVENMSNMGQEAVFDNIADDELLESLIEDVGADPKEVLN
jgi:hypothetical protein